MLLVLFISVCVWCSHVVIDCVCGRCSPLVLVRSMALPFIFACEYQFVCVGACVILHTCCCVCIVLCVRVRLACCSLVRSLIWLRVYLIVYAFECLSAWLLNRLFVCVIASVIFVWNITTRKTVTTNTKINSALMRPLTPPSGSDGKPIV